MRAILKSSNKILTTAGKIFQVGEIRPPVFDLDPDVLTQATNTSVALIPCGGNNAFQTTATRQPILRKNILNGHAVLEFDATDDFLNCENGVESHTVIMVMRHMQNKAILFNTLINAPDNMYAGLLYRGPGNDEFWMGSDATPIFRDGKTTQFGGNNTNRIYINGQHLPNKSTALVSQNFRVLVLDPNILPAPFFSKIGMGSGVQIARILSYNYRLTELSLIAKTDELRAYYSV